MSATENEALVTRIAEDVWNRGKLSVVDEVMAAEARYHGPHMPNGLGSREDWQKTIAIYRGAFPDAHVTFEQFITSQDISASSPFTARP